MDCSGRQLPQELRDYVDEHILRQRTSPQLRDEVVSKIIDTADELADSSEGPTNKLLRTLMFPIDHSGISCSILLEMHRSVSNLSVIQLTKMPAT